MVGLVLGNVEGLSEGDSEGLLDGLAVGNGDGAGDGGLDGAGVVASIITAIASTATDRRNDFMVIPFKAEQLFCTNINTIINIMRGIWYLEPGSAYYSYLLVLAEEKNPSSCSNS